MQQPSIQQQLAQNQQADTSLRFAKITESQKRIEEKLDRILEILKPDEVMNALKDAPKGTKSK